MDLEKPIQILELFGGIGAPRVALRNLGIPIKSIDYVEIDEKAVRSYNALFADDLEYRTQDVVNWNLKPDVLIHGSPCQDFSIAGHQKGADEGSETRSSLMWETLKIIENFGVWKPRIVVWENVKNVLSKHMRHNFQKYLERMEMLGYSSSYAVLDARDFGLPQKRQRVFTVSILGGPAFDFSKLEKKPMCPLKDFLEPTYKEAYIVKSPSMLKRIGQTDSKSFSGVLRILDPEGAAECVTTKQDRCPNSGVIATDDGRYRLLTEKECWLLQGFSDKDFEAAKAVTPHKEGFKIGALYKQAGNSMPVPILEELFKILLIDSMEAYIVTQPSVLECVGHKGIRRATVIDDCANTVTCRQDRTPAQVLDIGCGQYRYLTERECWRLMGFSDRDFDRAKAVLESKGRMNRDLYKQAGNSMPVPVMQELLRVALDA